MSYQTRLKEFALKQKIEVKLEDLVDSLGQPRAIIQGAIQGEPTKLGLFNSHMLILSKSLYWGGKYKLIPIADIQSVHFRDAALYFSFSTEQIELTDVDELQARVFIAAFEVQKPRPRPHSSPRSQKTA